MEVIDEGHEYQLHTGIKVRFMKRENGNMIYDGTTNEEVLEVLIDRLKFLQKKLSCRENAIVLTKLEESLMWLNKRTEKRTAQKVETLDLLHKD